MTAAPSAEALIIYGTPWCGPCRTLKRLLSEHNVAFSYVDIEQTPGAADFVMKINGGNQTVPTVVFSDGSTLTNPRLSDVVARLDLLAS